MYRPDRIGPHHFADVDNIPYTPNATVTAAAQTVWPAAPGILMRNITAREYDSDHYILSVTVTSHASNNRSLAIGQVLTGIGKVEDDSDNFLFTASGNATIIPGGLDWAIAQPIIARLDGAPVATQSSGQYDPTTITKWQSLPSSSSHHPTTGLFTSSFQTLITQGLLNGLNADADTTMIFIGWHFICSNTSGSDKAIYGEASIGCHKWLEDLQTYDPVK